MKPNQARSFRHLDRVPQLFLLAVLAGVAFPAVAPAQQTFRNQPTFRTQRFLGPQYPGERILSERVITPGAETTRSETRPAPSSGTPNSGASILARPQTGSSDREPVSLSDSRKPAAEVNFNDPSMLAMGHQIWQKMLQLERENAELKASLEYERKLATYRERTSDFQTAQTAEIAELRSQIEKLREEKNSIILQTRSDSVAESDTLTRVDEAADENPDPTRPVAATIKRAVAGVTVLPPPRSDPMPKSRSTANSGSGPTRRPIPGPAPLPLPAPLPESPSAELQRAEPPPAKPADGQPGSAEPEDEEPAGPSSIQKTDSTPGQPDDAAENAAAESADSADADESADADTEPVGPQGEIESGSRDAS